MSCPEVWENFMTLPTPVTYPEFFWADRLHLRVPPPPFRHHSWRKFLNFVPPDALKMYSLAVPVLRFLCKTFSKLRKLNNETLFSVDASQTGISGSQTAWIRHCTLRSTPFIDKS